MRIWTAVWVVLLLPVFAKNNDLADGGITASGADNGVETKDLHTLAQDCSATNALSIEEAAQVVFDGIEAHKSSLLADLVSFTRCIAPMKTKGGGKYHWDMIPTSKSVCVKLYGVLNKAAIKYMRHYKTELVDLDKDTDSIFERWMKRYKLNFLFGESEQRNKWEANFESCKKLLNREAIARTHNEERGPKFSCADIKTGKAGAQRMNEIVKMEQTKFEDDLEGLFACLVPLQHNGPFSWQVEPKSAESCQLFVKVISAFVEPFIGDKEHVHHNPDEIWRWVMERKHGKKFKGNFFSRISTYWKACTPKMPDREKGGMKPRLEGSELKIKITVGPGLPLDMSWPFPNDLVRAKTFCYKGVIPPLGSGKPYIGSTTHPPRTVKHTTVMLEKYEPNNGLSCLLTETEGAATYCINGKRVTCLMSTYVRKTQFGPPHLVIDESTVSDCPFAWSEAVGSTPKAPHYHLEMKKGLKLDRKPCRLD